MLPLSHPRDGTGLIMDDLLIAIALTILLIAVICGCRAVCRSDRRQQVIDVFLNHTAEWQSAKMLSDESGLSIEEIDVVLTELNKSHELRRIGIGNVPYYLYTPK